MLKKVCTKCNQEKPLGEFLKDTRIKSGRASVCGECGCKKILVWRKTHREKVNLYGRQWRAKNPDKVRAMRQRYFAKYKDKIYERHNKQECQIKRVVLTYYGGGKCACVRCGFDDIRALSIDHIAGNGAEHRRKVGMGNSFRWLKSHNYPKGYQSLCMNCQWIQRNENQELSHPHIGGRYAL